MNIFISMSVFELFNKLDKHLQDIIKLYYLSYGTRESNIMKTKINDLNQYKLNQLRTVRLPSLPLLKLV